MQKSHRYIGALETPELALRPGRAHRITGFWDSSGLKCQLLDFDGVVLGTRRASAISDISLPIATQLEKVLGDWDRQFGFLPITLSGPVSSPEGPCSVKSSACPIDLSSLPETAVQLHDSGRDITIVPGLSCMNRVGSPDYLWGEETALLGASKILPDLLRGSKTICVPGEITRWIVLRHGHVLFFTSSIPCTIFRMMKTDPLFKIGRVTAGINPDVFAKGVEKAGETPSTDLIHLLLQVRNRKLKQQLAASDMASFLLGMLIGRDVSEATRLLQLHRLRSPLVLLTDGLIGALYEKAIGLQKLRTSKVDLGLAIKVGLSQIK